MNLIVAKNKFVSAKFLTYHGFVITFTRECSLCHHLRELISANINLDHMRSRNFLPAEDSVKLSSFELLDLKINFIGYRKYAIWTSAPMLCHFRICICITFVVDLEAKGREQNVI